MALIKKFQYRFAKIGPIFLLYFLSISELDTEFSNYFEILSFNLQLIIVYYWMLKSPNILGNGHVFFAGIINDVIMGLPLGTSPISYLVVSFVASYVKNVTVNISLFTDWFTFLVALLFSNFIHMSLMINFTELNITYTDLFYNVFFTFLFYPIFWFLFNSYRIATHVGKDD